jgi:CHAD domain-containing protein
MSYRFQPQSTVEANARRILGEQLDKARYQLTENFNFEPAEAIHDARKRLKKARSVLRLLRKAMDKEAYKREKNALRDIGRLLAPARDAEAFRETLRALKQHYASVLEDDAFDQLQEGLVELHLGQLRHLIDDAEPMATAITDLKDSHLRLKGLKLDKTGWDAIHKGLEKIYRQGSDRMITAYDEVSDATFHEWRKRVKDLWYDTRLLRSVWPPVMRAWISESHQLSKYLGNDHDIAEFRQFLLKHQDEAPLQNTQLKLLLPLMKHRQGQLRQQAKALGDRLYAEDSDAFAGRIGTYWQSWLEASEA